MIDAQGYEPPEEWTWNNPDAGVKETKCGGGCGHIHMCGQPDVGGIWECQWCYRSDRENDPQGRDTRPRPWTLTQKLDRLAEDNPSIAAAAQRLDDTIHRLASGRGVRRS